MIHGLLIVDKTRGPTSHDVVAKLRRLFGTRAVGHAGTLDPMATGVLVAAVGEATKLVRWLTDDDKTYEASVRLGVETDSLDADGDVVAEAPVPTSLDRERVEGTIATFVGVHAQRAPRFSALKVDGQRLHRQARRGVVVEAPLRDVNLLSFQLQEVTADSIRVTLKVAKGFYVRSFARDLAQKLGTVGHLDGLRRIQSGVFGLDRAVSFDRVLEGLEDERVAESVRESALSLREACAHMIQMTLSEPEVKRARHGQPVRRNLADSDDPVAMLSGEGRVVAIGRIREGVLRVVRGLRSE